MPQAVFEIVAAPARFDCLPISLDQRTSRGSALVLLMLLAPALAMLLLPAALLAVFAGPALDIAARDPIAAFQVVVGLLLWGTLLALPMRRIIQRLGRARTVRIADGFVSVRERSPFGATQWRAPLCEFRGVTHHVRATLSGWRHELILVHADRAHSVLLHAADGIPASMIERASALLRLPEISARELYRHHPSASTALVARAPVTAEPLAA